MIDGHTARLLSFVSIQWIRWTSDNFYVCVFPLKSHLAASCVHQVTVFFKKKHMSIRVWLWQYVSTDTNILNLQICVSFRIGIPRRISRLIFVQMVPSQPSTWMLFHFSLKATACAAFSFETFQMSDDKQSRQKEKKAQDRNVTFHIFPVVLERKSPTIKGRNTRSDIIYWRRVLDIISTVYQIKKRPAGKEKKKERNGEMNSMDAFNRGRQHTHI